MGQLPNDKGKTEHSNVLLLHKHAHTHCHPEGQEHGHVLTDLQRYDVNQWLIIVINVFAGTVLLFLIQIIRYT